MSRWKCPDCKGWVADRVDVHNCPEAKVQRQPFSTGNTCQFCGAWYSGSYHICYYSPQQYPYVSGSGTGQWQLRS